MPHQMWIKAALKAKGFKLKDMAEALGITAPRVTDVLRGSREVQSDELAALAELLGMNLKSLLASLKAGEHKELPYADSRLAVLGHLMGDGTLTPLSPQDTLSYVALPPDAQTSDGLSCYVMGDNSMAQEIKAGDIIIAADPRKFFYPMVPGALFLVRVGAEKLALRQFVKSDGGENWLVPLPEHPDPKLSSWRFNMLPPALDDKADTGATGTLNPGQNVETSSKTDKEIPAGGIVHTGHIAAAVLWVHRRYIP